MWKLPQHLILSFLLRLHDSLAVNNGLARTPPLGWNNWNSLGCDVSADLLLDTASKLVTLGLMDVGYKYAVLDDCWSDGRDANGRLQVDKSRFPQGMETVSAKIHDHGLLFGIYSSAGHMTCARAEGSLDHEEEDAQTFADFSVDYLKYDNCYSTGRAGSAESTFKRYDTMAKALNATGRPIVYSLCNWGEDFVMSWGVSIANSWRISGDIYDSFSRPDDRCSCTANDPSSPWCVSPGAHCSVLTILNKVAPYADRSQPGGWQDLDALEVGLGGMTTEEYKAHFALWAALKSPLLIGADLRTLTPEALKILNNPAILAINQDPLGVPATRVARNTSVPKDRYGEGETHIWSGPLAGGDEVLILLNAADADLDITAYLEDIFVGEGPSCSAPQCNEDWHVHDLWSTMMEDSIARSLIDKSHSRHDASRVFKSLNWYNASTLSYRDGLDQDDSRLLGETVGKISARGSWTVPVKRHSAKVYRLRPASDVRTKRYSIFKDEL
jgi:alpha-galactosidase